MAECLLQIYMRRCPKKDPKPKLSEFHVGRFLLTCTNVSKYGRTVTCFCSKT